MTLFGNKYRTQSNRMPKWDYSRNGYYYITMVINNRNCILGNIKNEKMVFSDFGKIINDEWNLSFKIRDELFLDEYIIMPNHMHAIIILNNKSDKKTGNLKSVRNNGIIQDENGFIRNDDGFIRNDDGFIRNAETHGRASQHADQTDQTDQTDEPYQTNEPTQNDQYDPNNPTINHNTDFKLYRQPKSISSFIAGFKSAVTTKIDNFIDLHQLGIPKYNRNNR
ncbi:MAG: hypothetical protein GQ527_02940, partial [Bacteroidales bacterium]|nr:hypothetical protein [Bacteroidales bacterium]